MNTITQITKKVLNFVEQELKNQIVRSIKVNPFSLSIGMDILKWTEKIRSVLECSQEIEWRK